MTVHCLIILSCIHITLYAVRPDHFHHWFRIINTFGDSYSYILFMLFLFYYCSLYSLTEQIFFSWRTLSPCGSSVNDRLVCVHSCVKLIKDVSSVSLHFFKIKKLTFLVSVMTKYIDLKTHIHIFKIAVRWTNILVQWFYGYALHYCMAVCL